MDDQMSDMANAITELFSTFAAVHNCRVDDHFRNYDVQHAQHICEYAYINRLRQCTELHLPHPKRPTEKCVLAWYPDSPNLIAMVRGNYEAPFDVPIEDPQSIDDLRDFIDKWFNRKRLIPSIPPLVRT